MSVPGTRDEIFFEEADERQRLYGALNSSVGISELDERKRASWRTVESVFGYLTIASLKGQILHPIDHEFFVVMQALANQIHSGRLPEPLSIGSKQGSPATAHERHDIGNAVLYLLAASDPLSPISNSKPREIVAKRYGVKVRTVSNWKAAHDRYLANRADDPQTLREDWLRIIREMKKSGQNYSRNKSKGKRREV